MADTEFAELIRLISQIQWSWAPESWPKIETVFSLERSAVVSHSPYGRVDYTSPLQGSVWSQWHGQLPLSIFFEVSTWPPFTIGSIDDAIRVFNDSIDSATSVLARKPAYNGTGDSVDAPLGQSSSLVASWDLDSARLMIQYLEAGLEMPSAIVVVVCAAAKSIMA